MWPASYSYHLKLGQILGFIPWINQNSIELSDKIPYKILPAIIAISFLLQQCLQMVFSKDVINVSLLTLACTTSFSSVRSAYINMKEWKKLCQLYKVISKGMKSKLDYTLDIGIQSFMIVIFYSLYLLSIRVVSYYDNIRDFNLFIDLLLFVSQTKDCLTIFILSILTKGFRVVNKHAKYLLYGGGISSVGNSALNGTTPTFCLSLYKKLYEMSICVNEIFGWMVASTLLNYVIRTCLSIQKLLILTKNRNLIDVRALRFGLVFTYRTVSNFIQNINQLK